jgi:hypothetical protein
VSGAGRVPNEDHFRRIATQAHNLVVFLGAGVNGDGGGVWQPGSDRLPDDRELASHLAASAGLTDVALDLAEVAQRARVTHGEAAMLEWLAGGVRLPADANLSEVHGLLAGLPAWWAQFDLEPRYQMIVTTKYDAALERAFGQAQEPFDAAVYTGPRAARGACFVHVPWGGFPRPVEQPNRYPPTDQPELGFPQIAVSRRLMRTIVVRISSAIDDDATGLDPDGKHVITEDDYIDFMSGRPIEEVVPAQLLAKLRHAHYLFLGYTIIPWRLRVFLRRLWGGSRLGGQKYWAVNPEPDQLEDELWTEAGVSLFQISPTEYLRGLYAFIRDHRDELAQ